MSEETTRTPHLVVDDIHMTYGTGATAHDVLGGISLTVSYGEFVCIVGPSGAGKTTLLRCLSGLLRPTAGAVSVAGRQVTQPVPEIAVVFQDYRGSLMPWLQVWDNVALPLQGMGVKKSERMARAEESLEAVGLHGVGGKYPWQLSGGMQQRVSIARAIAYRSPILLMDEPFGSVDAQARFELEDLALRLRRELGITVVVVTHDIDEAVYLSDRVVVMAGRPTHVVDDLAIDLGPDRDQITTRALPRFAELRTRVLEEIRAGQPTPPGSSAATGTPAGPATPDGRSGRGPARSATV
ncbi:MULTISPECIES: ABC transporter ATP-binding protein [Actinomadura]|uniref:ABC transporter ATP-binding protein n=1 Tax=Actinomadura TaxID=1988 RepID=UPI0003AD4A84|nr:ABC transporter ATP-binding protein [Actinomadura madurae]